MTARPPTALVKKSVSLGGHRTSIALEAAFWDELAHAAHEQDRALAALIADIDAARGPDAPLASSLRLFVLERLKRNAKP